MARRSVTACVKRVRSRPSTTRIVRHCSVHSAHAGASCAGTHTGLGTRAREGVQARAHPGTLQLADDVDPAAGEDAVRRQEGGGHTQTMLSVH